MSEESRLDQEVDLAMAFLLGFAVPKVHYSQTLLTAWTAFKPPLDYWSHAPSLWDAVIDLQSSVDRFKTQVQAFDKQKARFPCIMRAGDPPLPVDPKALPRFDTSPLGAEFDNEAETPKLNTENLPIELLPTEDVARFFISRLSSFLHSRLSASAVRSRHAYTSPSGPVGLRFDVTTLTPGLNVHYTSQFFFISTLFFGAPTTPVRGYIQPGRWHFGTSQGNSAITFDFHTVYDVPTVSSAHLAV